MQQLKNPISIRSRLWFPSRGASGEYGWINMTTGQFTTVDPYSGLQRTTESTVSNTMLRQPFNSTTSKGRTLVARHNQLKKTSPNKQVLQTSPVEKGWDYLGLFWKWLSGNNATAAYIENPAVMTAAGWTMKPDGSVVLDAFNTEERNKLADNLATIGTTPILAHSVITAPLTFLGSMAGGTAVDVGSVATTGKTVGEHVSDATNGVISPEAGELANLGYWFGPKAFSSVYTQSLRLPWMLSFVGKLGSAARLDASNRIISRELFNATKSMSDDAKVYFSWKSMADRLRNELTFDPSQNKIVHLDDTGLLPVNRRGFVPKTDTSKYEIGVSPELENDGWSSFVINMDDTPQEAPAIWWNRNKPYYSQDFDLSTAFQRALVADTDKVGAKGATRADGTVVKTEGTVPFSDVQGFEAGIGPWYNRVLYLGSHALNPTQNTALGTLTWQEATDPHLRFSSDIDWNLASKTLSSKELEAFQRMTPELLKSASKDYPQLFTSDFVPISELLTVKYYPYMLAYLLQAVLDAIQRRIAYVNGPKFLSRLDKARSEGWFKNYTDDEIRRAMTSRFYQSEDPTTVKAYYLGESNGEVVGDGSELILNSELPPTWNPHVASHETYHASTRNIKPKRDDGLSLKVGPKNRDEEIILEVMSYNNSLAPYTPLLYPYNIKLENGVESPVSPSFAKYMRDPQERGAEAWAILDHFGTDENAAIQALQAERAIGKPSEATGAFSNLLKKFNATSSPEGGEHYMRWFLGLAPWLTFGAAVASYKKGGPTAK